MDSALAKAFELTQKVWLRRTRYYFSQWREEAIEKIAVIKQLRAIMMKHLRKRMAMGFYKWSRFLVDEKFQVRKAGLAVQLVCYQMRLKILNAWRCHMSQTRVAKFSIRLRTYKNMKVNVQRKKYEKLFAIWINRMPT